VKEADDVNSFRTAVTAAPDGIATFVHLQATAPASMSGDVVVRLEGPMSELVMQKVSVREPPAQPVVLQLPACGSLRIPTGVAPGRPFRPAADELYAHFYQEGATSASRARWQCWPGGVLDLPHVGLGLRFRVVLECDECTGGMELAGPTQPGERVVVELPVTV